MTTVALLALGLAMTAQAGPRLYSGSLIIHAFANDITDGSTVPFTENILHVVPFGANCNTKPFHARETQTVPTYYNTNTYGTAGNGKYHVFTIPNYGGQIADFHTSYSTWIVEGCGAPTLTDGRPLRLTSANTTGSGKGAIVTTGAYSTSRSASNPRGFTIPASHLVRVTGGSFAYAFPYAFEVHYADLRNVKGTFAKSAGPGRFAGSTTFTYVNSPIVGGKGSIAIKPGANKFGGTMRLLGTYYSNWGHASSVYDHYVGKDTWLFDFFGAEGLGSQTPATSVDHNLYVGRFYGFANTTTVAAYAFSWTTGTVTVTAIGGPFQTVMARKGHDNRTPHGSGEIQMVSPAITRWIFGDGTRAYFKGGIGILKVQVAPEPHEWMLLGSGLSMLTLLYRANRRSR